MDVVHLFVVLGDSKWMMELRMFRWNRYTYTWNLRTHDAKEPTKGKRAGALEEIQTTHTSEGGANFFTMATTRSSLIAGVNRLPMCEYFEGALAVLVSS